MKICFKSFGCLFMLFFTGMLVMAQTFSYKSLSQELQSLEKQLVPDKRVAILDFELKDTLQQTIVITGETNLPDAKYQIIRFLADNNVKFIDSLRLLPDASLGVKTWALATLSVSNLRALPDHTTELLSQVMMGTPLKILDHYNNWFRVQTPEYYIGWMDSSGLERITQKELEHWKASDRYLFNAMSGYVYNVPAKKGEVVSDLVRGDLFEVERAVKGFLKIRIPDGRSGYVRKAVCISFDKWSNQEPNVKAVLKVAGQMMGSPYLWGGTSSKGVDCSGFVKLVYYDQGIILARDASQQARYGYPVEFRNPDKLQPGDLLFFGRSALNITHVGIYLGKGNFIHSSGRVHINSIDPTDPNYTINRNIVTARRILNSLNTEGITRVKDHPWYNDKS